MRWACVRITSSWETLGRILIETSPTASLCSFGLVAFATPIVQWHLRPRIIVGILRAKNPIEYQSRDRMNNRLYRTFILIRDMWRWSKKVSLQRKQNMNCTFCAGESMTKLLTTRYGPGIHSFTLLVECDLSGRQPVASGAKTIPTPHCKGSNAIRYTETWLV